MSIVIRPATEADYEAISWLFEQGDAWHRQHLPELFRTPDQPGRERQYILDLLANAEMALLVAEDAGKLAGLIYVMIAQARDLPILVPRRYAVIDHMVVEEVYRQQGIGRALMEAAEEWAQQQGVADIELNVFKFNQGAIALYEALGYTTRSQRMHKSLADYNPR